VVGRSLHNIGDDVIASSVHVNLEHALKHAVDELLLTISALMYLSKRGQVDKDERAFLSNYNSSSSINHNAARGARRSLNALLTSPAENTYHTMPIMVKGGLGQFYCLRSIILQNNSDVAV
jgi:hypothetical protein